MTEQRFQIFLKPCYSVCNLFLPLHVNISPNIFLRKQWYYTASVEIHKLFLQVLEIAKPPRNARVKLLFSLLSAFYFVQFVTLYHILGN